MHTAALILLLVFCQQPQWAKGTTQQQWNRECELNLKAMADAIEAGRGEVTEVGKIIQGELETTGNDVEKLRQQVVQLSMRMSAKDEAKPVEQPPIWPFGAGLMIVGAGLLAINSIRLWADLRMMRLVPGFILTEERTPPPNHICSENARLIPDPAIK